MAETTVVSPAQPSARPVPLSVRRPAAAKPVPLAVLSVGTADGRTVRVLAWPGFVEVDVPAGCALSPADALELAEAVAGAGDAAQQAMERRTELRSA